MVGHSATRIRLVCLNVLVSRGTVGRVSSSILTTSSLSPRCTIMVITATGPLLGKGMGSEDLTLKYVEAVFFEEPPSSSWQLLELSSSALDQDRFLVMAMICSPVVMYWSLPTRRSDLKENPACRCPGFPSRTLPPRPFSEWLLLSWPVLVWPRLQQSCLPHSRARCPGSFSFRQPMPIWWASSEEEEVWYLWW